MLGPHSYKPPEDGLPPDQVRILALRAEPWPNDDRRVRVHLDVTPFLERPNLEVAIFNAAEQEVASISIIETIDDRMTFTMHIRGETVEESYILTASIAYPEIGVVDQKRLMFAISKKEDPAEDS